jgi:hypothetical protein
MKALVVTLLVLLAAACGGMPPVDTLNDSVRLYNEGIRWQRWDRAANFLPQKERSKWVDESDERGKDLKVTEYDVVRIDQKGEKTAKVQVKLSWYKDSEGTVHETHAMQTWEKHGKDWLLVDEARLRGFEMPGLPEPLMKDGEDGSATGSGKD